MGTLIVLRHAKAEHTFGVSDSARVLTGRGRRDATAAGNWLRSEGLHPDQVLCSPSQRTRDTLECLGVDAPVAYPKRIYRNDVDDLLDLIRTTDEAIGTLLLIGHNPSFHQLVHDLTGDAPETFPTCALAVITLGTWAAAHPATATLQHLWTPKTP